MNQDGTNSNLTHEGVNAGSEAQRLLDFSLGAERYAIQLSTVKEVIAVPSITPIPETPPYFLGLMNLRGQIIPIVDLRLKLKTKRLEGTGAENAVVILDLSPLCVGVVVDSVNSVLAIEKSQISPCPEVEMKANSQYLLGVVRSDDKLVLLLNVFQVFNVEDKKVIDQHMNNKG